MSKGIGGKCRKFGENEAAVYYEYSVYNSSIDADNEDVYDGSIIIFRSGLVEPTLKKNIQESPSGGKEIVTERIHKDVSIEDLVKKGLVVIDSSERSFMFTKSGIDIIGIRLCNLLFEIYQDEGCLPEKITYRI